ncbi:hypothetical protein [Winogradskyella sp. SYSU M77433]|uniref:PID-CTERM protein-sorting domain-containing protein n=1 Tax=Winogradskyella sp. SYSU M77433 TaxID=3042722 RepID=UPI002480EBF1|nr:hypothetical protein [Winogradskyella sp. SYSU M77433]MDH7913792.1 hypothetical protein [Winogradskyella sp. SYSU M77433]
MQNKNMFASILFFFVSVASIAQVNQPPPPAPPPPPFLPIDNGVVFLFIAALIYGAYKVYKISRKVA